MIECENIKNTGCECGNMNIVLDEVRGEITCDCCGLVLSQKLIDSGAEWRAYTRLENKKRRRVGSPMRLSSFDKNLNTRIGIINKDAYGKQITPNKRAEMHRLRKWDSRSKRSSSRLRNLDNALNQLSIICSQLRLPRGIREDSSYIYRKVISKNLLPGRTIESYIAASIYLSCRSKRGAITLKDFLPFVSVNRRNIFIAAKTIMKSLSIKLPIASPLDYIDRYSSELGYSEGAKNLSMKILEHASKHPSLTGKNPIGIAITALYIAANYNGEKKTQIEVVSQAGITEASLRMNRDLLLSIVKLE